MAAPRKKKLTKYQTFKPRRINRSQMVLMPGNPQGMNADQEAALSQALDVDNGGVGLLETIVWNKRTGRVLGGNHRTIDIDRKEGFDADDTSTDYAVDVAEVDVDEDDEKAIVLLLNNRRLQGQPTVDALREFLGGMDESHRTKTGFTSDDCAYLLGDAEIEVADKNPPIGELLWGRNFKEVRPSLDVIQDDVPDPSDSPVIQPGELWSLGGHRLLCGDATDANDVTRLLDGETPFMMVTDPPYGVDYQPGWRNDVVGEFGANARVGEAVANDDQCDWTKAWALFPGVVVYVWHASYFSGHVANQLIANGFQIRSSIIWKKQHFAVGRSHYQWAHEPCWYATKGGSAKWCGDRKQSTIWEISSLNPAGRQEQRFDHGTQKPVECMARPVSNHGDDSDAVYDPFGGSGTTIIAAQQLGRRCFMMEIDPRYVQLTLERFRAFAGEDPVREDGTKLSELIPIDAGQPPVDESAEPVDAEELQEEDAA